MTRKTNSTRKARKTRNRKPLNLKNLRTMWRKANPIARIGMVATATVAAIAAIAIIVGAVRFIGWRVQVNEALTAQSQSQSQYDFNPRQHHFRRHVLQRQCVERAAGQHHHRTAGRGLQWRTMPEVHDVQHRIAVRGRILPGL